MIIKILVLLYAILKIYVRFIIRFYCYSIRINRPKLLKQKGPLLIASNHPNSFLDAVFLDILFGEPIWSLARGDVFRKKWARPILHSLRIFPVYRNREGAENLSENYKTFDACIEIFKQNGVVTIFSEGLCVKEWHLRPLLKGTARLAFKAWEEGIPLKILPVGINYSSFERFGKQIDVNVGNAFTVDLFNLQDSDGILNRTFNKRLEEKFKKLVYEIAPEDNETFDQKFNIKANPVKEAVLFLPSLLGKLLHLPGYYLTNFIIKYLKTDKVHNDSMKVAFLIFGYPLYLLVIFFLLWLLTGSIWSLTAFLLLPLLLLAYVKRKVRKDWR